MDVRALCISSRRNCIKIPLIFLGFKKFKSLNILEEVFSTKHPIWVNQFLGFVSYKGGCRFCSTLR